MRKVVFFFCLLSLNLFADVQKRALVAGGAGFIGTHLCKKLLDQGHEVYCVDNFYTGRLENVEGYKKNPNFHLIIHDVSLPLHLEPKFSVIFNLACPASPVHYQNDPISTIKTSVFGAFYLLDIAKRDDAVYFQASSSEVYGDPKEHPQNEEYYGNVNPIGLRACYDESKRISETICFEYNRQFGTKIKVGRIFNTYGPGMSMDDGRVVSNFITQALKSIPITIYGDGSQARSFCYVDDLVEAIVRFSETPQNITGPINLGNPSEFTIKELAELIELLTPISAEIAYYNLPEDNPKLRCPNIAKATKTLNWVPTIALQEGLKKTIPYFEKEVSKSLELAKNNSDANMNLSH